VTSPNNPAIATVVKISSPKRRTPGLGVQTRG
jgi:hypothetical protein